CSLAPCYGGLPSTHSFPTRRSSDLSSPLRLFRVSRHASNPSPIAQAFGRTLIRRGAPDGYVGGLAQGGRWGRGLLGGLRIGSGGGRVVLCQGDRCQTDVPLRR